MKSSILFNTMQKQITELQLDYDKILALPEKSWPKICDQLELGKMACMEVSEDEGRAICSVLVERIKRDNEIARQDQDLIEYELELAQGREI
jgi:hypothetical protein